MNEKKYHWGEGDDKILEGVIYHLRYSCNNRDTNKSAGLLEDWLLGMVNRVKEG